MGTAIGMWICVILTFVSFFGGIVLEHEIIGCIVGLLFVFLGMKIFNAAPVEYRRAVGELQRQEEYKKLHGGCKCPSCGMMAGYKIDTFMMEESIEMFGVASDLWGKTYKCENCRYTW